MLKDIGDLPHEPGCYLFKNKAGGVIYVGKAKDLKKRVSSYFAKNQILRPSGRSMTYKPAPCSILSLKGTCLRHPRPEGRSIMPVCNDLDAKTRSLVDNIASLDYIITANEKEALILENNLIKKHLPKYNIDLRDSKRYAYVMLTKEDYPRLLVARRVSDEGTYFGPFTSAEKRDALLRMTNNLMKLRTCRKMPKRACLRAHMEKCTAPCVKKASHEQYLIQVEDAKKLLSGRNAELLEDLRSRMSDAAKKREYEYARTLRDQIAGIEFLQEKQSMETQKKYDQDIIDYIVDGSAVHLAVFNAERGILANKDEYGFDYSEGFLEEFLLRYYSNGEIPKEIILPERVSDAFVSYLSEKRGSKVSITVPQRGEKKDLLDLVKKNVEKLYKEDELALQDLREKLGLQKIPKVIECFDISHIQGSDPVGSMVRFLDGKPDKSNYRRYRIKSVEGIDDPGMIAEVVGRRYKRLLDEEKSLPDLIIVDGGRTQVSAAHRELRALGLGIPLIGLAKRLEEIYFVGLTEPQRIDHKSRALKLLQNVRDEAHRFAVKYHKVLRSKRTLGKK